MAEFTLEANERKVDKQSQLKEIRLQGRVPGIVYGFSQKPVLMDLEYGNLLKVLKEAGTSNIITIKAGGKDIKVIVREYQQDPVTDKLIHVDFMAVSDKRKITTKVPLEFIGQSKAVREQGGKLNVKANTVDVKCLPADLPNKITIDLSIFTELGQKLIISDLQVADNVEILNNPNNPVADVTVPKQLVLSEPTVETKVEGEEGQEGEDGEKAEGGEDKKAESGEDKKADEDKK